MSDIQNDLLQIKRAIYGEEVRDSIVDAIEQCYNDVSAGTTSATAAAQQAQNAASAANAAALSADAAALGAQRAASGALGNFADEFSESKDYSPGDYVTRNGNLYRFTEVHAAASWNSAHVVKKTVGDEIENTTAIIAHEFSPTTDYSVGEYVVRGMGLYRFRLAHPAGAWVPEHVSAITVANELKTMSVEIDELTAMFAHEFNSSTDYFMGEYVVKDMALYRFRMDHPAGDWNDEHVWPVTVANELNHTVVKYDHAQSLTNDEKTQARENIGAASAGIAGNFAVAFNPSTTYQPGQYCVYNGSLYRFIASHTGAWSDSDSSSYAVAVTIANEINSTTVKTNLSQDFTGDQKARARRNIDAASVASIAVAFNPSTTYQPGQYCVYNGSLYRFIASHTGAWSDSDSSSYAVAVTIANEINSTTVKTNLSQSLTDDQKTRARNNIGAASADEINELNNVTSNNVDILNDISTPITSDITTVRTDSTFINNQGAVTATGSSYYTLSADVTAGIKYIVNGFAAQNCYLYIFVDSGGNTIYKSKEKGATGGTNYSEVVATAPTNAAKLIVDGNIGGSRTPAFIGKLDGYYATDNGFIPTAEISIIPSSLFPHYPFIDSINSKITIYNSTIIIDRRTINKRYYTVAEDLTVDYSGISSSAIAIYFDVANSSFIAVQYSNGLDANKYLLFMLIRTNVVSANHITVSAAFPVIIDGMIDGVVYSKNKNIRSINHRGLEQVAPENTLIAFKYSQMAGFDGVETDVRFTSDNVPVLLHDATINRTARNADGTEISGDIAIADITYQEALTYDFGVFKNSRFAGTKIPTFEQFIKTCRNLGLHPYIELKVGTEQQIQNLNTIVIRNGMQGKVTWISYSLAFLGYIHSVNAKARLGVVSSVISSSTDFINQILALKSENEVFYDLDNFNAITNEGVERLIALGLPLELYTGTIANIVNADPYVTGFTLGAFNGGKELIAHWDTTQTQ